MNVDKILALAEFLESLPPTKQFSMTTWGEYDRTDDGCNLGRVSPESRHECGSPACIAGWHAREFLTDEQFDRVTGRGTTWDWALVGVDLGLNESDSHALFIPQTVHINPGLYGAKQARRYVEIEDPVAAAQVLRHLAATGKVDWSKAGEYLDCLHEVTT